MRRILFRVDRPLCDTAAPRVETTSARVAALFSRRFCAGDSPHAWDLRRALFSLKDHHTGAASCVGAEERLAAMDLMDGWARAKLFRESGWVKEVQERGETAPQCRSVVGEKKILRYLLHRYLSDELLWRDDLQSLLELVLGRAGAALNSFDHPDDSSLGADSDDAVPIVIPDSLLLGPEKMNFYSYGLQDVLWKFLRAEDSFFGGACVLWYMFVASQRNMLSLPSPQRPPFSSYESLPTLTEAEFAEWERPAVMREENERPDNPEHSVTLHWPDEWKMADDAKGQVSVDDGDEKAMSVDDERRRVYARDEFYMDIVEPDEALFLNHKDNPSSMSIISASPSEDKKQEPQQKTDASHVSKRVGRTLLNPANGELEDVHLTHLWKAFQQLKPEDSVDMYRAVCGRLERMREEVFMDILARRGLLMLFFARDEVRAVTPPWVTYSRLMRLHRELIELSTWASPLAHDRTLPPLSFTSLSLSSQLSFSCFGQLHAPVQRHLYKLAAPAPSPAHLYNSYCERYGRFLVREESSSQNSAEKDEGEKGLVESPDMSDMCRFPEFERLTDLQQMAFRYPFGDMDTQCATSEPRVDDSSDASGDAYSSETMPARINEDHAQIIDDKKSAVVVKRRGRRAKMVDPTESEETKGPAVAVKRRGRPKIIEVSL